MKITTGKQAQNYTEAVDLVWHEVGMVRASYREIFERRNNLSLSN
jgi:hypothetical protein